MIARFRPLVGFLSDNVRRQVVHEIDMLASSSTSCAPPLIEQRHRTATMRT